MHVLVHLIESCAHACIVEECRFEMLAIIVCPGGTYLNLAGDLYQHIMQCGSILICHKHAVVILDRSHVGEWAHANVHVYTYQYIQQVQLSPEEENLCCMQASHEEGLVLPVTLLPAAPATAVQYGSAPDHLRSRGSPAAAQCDTVQLQYCSVGPQ